MKTLFRGFRAYLLTTILAVAATAAEPPTQVTERFLFIGNSFTFRHELKGIFQALAKEGNPSREFTTERITYGGRDLFRHFELYKIQDLLSLSTLTHTEST